MTKTETRLKKQKRFIECDCVLLSVGLIPETELLKNQIDFFGGSANAKVDENRMTSLDGVFVAEIHFTFTTLRTMRRKKARLLHSEQ